MVSKNSPVGHFFWSSLCCAWMVVISMPAPVKAQEQNFDQPAVSELFYDVVRREDGKLYSTSPTLETVFAVGDALDVAAVGATSSVLSALDNAMDRIPRDGGIFNTARRQSLRGVRSTVRLGSGLARTIPGVFLAGAEAAYTAESFDLPLGRTIAAAVGSEVVARASPICRRSDNIIVNSCAAALGWAVPDYISSFDAHTNAELVMRERVARANALKKFEAQAEADAQAYLVDAAARTPFVTTPIDRGAVWFNAPPEFDEDQVADDAVRNAEHSLEDFSVEPGFSVFSNLPPSPSPRPDLPVSGGSQRAGPSQQIAQNQGVNLDVLRSGQPDQRPSTDSGLNLDSIRQAPSSSTPSQETRRDCPPLSTQNGVWCRARALQFGEYPNLLTAYQSGQISCRSAIREAQRQRAAVRRFASSEDACWMEGIIANVEAVLSHDCGPAQPFSCR